MPRARAELAADLEDGVLAHEGRVARFTAERIESVPEGGWGGLVCPAVAVGLGVVFGLVLAQGERGAAGVAWGVIPPGLGLGLAAWLAADATIVVDLTGRTATRTTRWRVGYERVEVEPLDALRCVVDENTDDDDHVVSCDVDLEDPRAWFGPDWTLLTLKDCARARALCEHITANVHATTPVEAP